MKLEKAFTEGRKKLSRLAARKPEIVFMFDFDATLADTLGPQSKMAGKLINKHFNLPMDQAKKIYFDKKDKPFENKLEEMFPNEPKEKIKACADEYFAQKGKLLDEVKLFPDTEKTLLKLKEHTRVVSSNNKEEVIRKVLRDRRVLDCFADVYGRETGKRKEHIEKVRKEFKPKLIVYVSDSALDMSLADYDVLMVGRAGDFDKGQTTVDRLVRGGADLATADMARITRPGIIRGMLLKRYAKELSRLGKKKAVTLFVKKG
jgi:FMN phosphatase YigB (HAD superfamily)